jgi:hypothetical protein
VRSHGAVESAETGKICVAKDVFEEGQDYNARWCTGLLSEN